MHVAGRSALQSGARRLLLHARGPKRRGCAGAQRSAAHHGLEKERGPRIPKTRAGLRESQLGVRPPVLSLLQPLADALSNDPARRIQRDQHQRRLGDCLLMLDHDFGVLLDQLDELGIADNTIVVFAGDNGAEDHLVGRGTAGFFDGSYFSSAEGGIRTPLLIRWPGRIKSGTESNEMVHVTDMFTTLLGFAGCEAPCDRLIDGVDQGPFFLDKQEKSNREACMVWLNEELHAIKWKDFKINFKRQQHFHDPELPLGFARITHLLEDPKEREPVSQRYVRWWVMQHAHRVVRELEASTKREQLIPSGSPSDFVPKTGPLS